MAALNSSLHFFRALFRRGNRQPSTRHQPTRGRSSPTLEVLEDRTLLNFAPVLSVPSGPFSVVKTALFSLQVSATDSDKGQILTFSLSNAPAGAAITSTQGTLAGGSTATGLLTWTPTEDQGPASYTFTVTVTDNGKPVKSASQQITVTTLAAGLVGNNLLIVGTSGDDTASIVAPTNANVISVTVNGTTTGPFTVPSGGQIQVKMFAGNDTFTTNESPVLVGPAAVVDEGTGSNTLIINGTSGPDAFTITDTKVGLGGAGDVNYTNVQSLTVNALGGNDTVAMTGINAGTATTIDGGADQDSFASNFGQGYAGNLRLASFESASMQVTGDFNGSLTVNDPGVLQLSVTGNVTATSAITATNISSLTLGTLSGQVTAVGGSIVGVNITTIASSGSLQATEASGTPGSGVISNATIGTNSGSISAGSISGMTVGTNAGSILAAGQGTATGVSIGTNTTTGSFTKIGRAHV